MNNNYNYNGQSMDQNQNFQQQPINQNQNYQQQSMSQNQNYQQPMYQPNGYAQSNMMGVKSKPKWEFPKDKVSIIGLIGALIIAIGSFCDFAKLAVMLDGTELYSATVNYLHSSGEIKDGVLVLGLAIVVVILILFRKNIFSLIPAAIASIIVAIDVSDLFDRVDKLKATYSANNFYDVDVKCTLCIAIYLIVIGIILVVVHAILKLKENKKNGQPTGNNMVIPQPMSYGMPNPNVNMYNQQPQYPNNNNFQGPNNMM